MTNRISNQYSTVKSAIPHRVWLIDKETGGHNFKCLITKQRAKVIIKACRDRVTMLYFLNTIAGKLIKSMANTPQGHQVERLHEIYKYVKSTIKLYLLPIN